ncbi:MAG: S9 family peptidase [Acetobacteraceae bacterium]
MTQSTDAFTRIGAASAPAFTKDGRSLFHLRGAGTPQLWVVAADGAEERAITRLDEKVAFLRRAPTDDRVIFGIDAGGDERQQLWLFDGQDSRPLTAAPGVIHDFGAWSPDGSRIAYAANDRDEAHFDILVRPIDGPARRVHQGMHQLGVAAWHPTEDRLLLIADRADGDQSLQILTLSDGGLHEVPSHGQASYKSVRWSRDGSHLLGLTDADGRAFLALCRIDPASGDVTPWVEAPGCDVEAWALSPDGSMLATVENERGYALLRVAAEDAALRPTVEGLPPGIVADLAWSPDNTALAMTVSAPTHPPALYLYTPATHLARPVCEPAAAEMAFTDFALTAWDSFDGRSIPGWFARPPGKAPADGWPAVVWVHGGPAMQARANFRPDMQMLLAQGYAVLMPNVRGSTGYGRASTASDDRERRLDSVRDLAAAHRWLTAQPGIDPDRIGIMGQSYGGYMVLAAITEYPELWRAAVDYYGIADFATLLATTGAWRRGHRAREYGDPAVHADLFARISPIHRADRIIAPLLVLHGTRDPRVPFSESEQIVAALRGRGQPVSFAVFDYAGHGFIRAEDRRRAYAAVADFFARTL